MQTLKTICPMCFRVFSVTDEIDRIRCNFCAYDYELPRLMPGEDIEKNKHMKLNRY